MRAHLFDLQVSGNKVLVAAKNRNLNCETFLSDKRFCRANDTNDESPFFQILMGVYDMTIYGTCRAFFGHSEKKLMPEKLKTQGNSHENLSKISEKLKKPPTQLELLQFKSCIFIPKMCCQLNFSVNHIHYKLYDIQKCRIFRIH